MARPPAQELWQHAFWWLDDTINVSLPHELDVRRMVLVVKGLWLVGERPRYGEVKAYLQQLWPAWPDTQRRLRELWRIVQRNPHHRFRRLQWFDEPIYVIDLLCERHGLAPPEGRLRHVSEAALRHVHEAAQNPNQHVYVAARADLDAALDAIHRLRRLRVGAQALGEWFGEDDPRKGGAIRPQWW